MAITLVNTFEGGTNTTTLTQGVGGNTGGTSGNFFDIVTIGASAAVTFTTSSPIRGSVSCSCSTGASVVSASVAWSTSIGTAVAHGYSRIVFKVSSLSVTVPVFRVRGLAAQAYRVTINTSGKVELRNSANTVVATSSTTTVALNTSYMLRLDLPIGASVNPVLYIHNDPTNPTASETLSPTAVNAGTNNIDEATGGIVVSTANVNAVMIDDFVFTDQGLPGPAFQSAALTESVTTSESLASNTAATRAVTDSVTTADSVTRTVSLPRALTDSVTTGNAVTRTLLLTRAPTDSVSFAEALTRLVTQSRLLTDSLSFAEVVTAVVTHPTTGRDLVLTMGPPRVKWRFGAPLPPRTTFGQPRAKWTIGRP